jgi:hypothetical protein
MIRDSRFVIGGQRLLPRGFTITTAHGEGEGAQSLNRNRLATLDATAVTALGESRQRRVDLRQGLALQLRDRQTDVVAGFDVLAGALDWLVAFRVACLTQVSPHAVTQRPSPVVQQLDKLSMSLGEGSV